MSRTITAKAMAEGALLAVITAILTLIGAFIPLASFLTYLIVAVPIIIVIVRNNFSTGVVSSLVAAFLVGILTGPVTALFFYLQFMLMALAYGFLFKGKYGAGKILVTGTLVAAVSTILIIALTMLVGQFGLEQQKQALFETVDRTIKIYHDYGMMQQFEENGIDEEELRQILIGMINFFIRVLPSLLIIGSVFTAVTHFIMARIALKRLGHDIPKFPSFSHWHLPWYTVWGLIGGWGCYLLGDIYHSDILRIFGQNIMVAYGMILFILGLAVISFYIKKYRLSRLHRFIFFMAALLMFNGFILSTILIGMFDLVLDHRKLNKKPKAI
ncbi:MAG: YybS family protein [Peptococcaceae bacterium]